jgi:hypothetical protein
MDIENKRGRRDSQDSANKRIQKHKDLDNPEETKMKLEDAEYKDLKQRYNQDERDKNYILNDQEEIAAEARKAEDTNIELNESIDKIEEEQDLEFKEKISLIAKESFEEMKLLQNLHENFKTEDIYEAMIQKVFE